MRVSESLITTRLLEDGSHESMTLPSYASLFLAEIESLFGPRDRSFTLLGVVFDKSPSNPPQLWYPDSGIPPGDAQGRSRHVAISLSGPALTDPVRARWQLAHECVHLLDPWNNRLDGGPTTLLEEGLAVWYQNTRVPEAEWHEECYAIAEFLVTPLIGELSPAIKAIRREQGLRIGEITPDVLHEYCPGIHEQTLRNLCEPFQRQKGAG